jgi:hypothetical protein
MSLLVYSAFVVVKRAKSMTCLVIDCHVMQYTSLEQLTYKYNDIDNYNRHAITQYFYPFDHW